MPTQFIKFAIFLLTVYLMLIRIISIFNGPTTHLRYIHLIYSLFIIYNNNIIIYYLT